MLVDGGEQDAILPQLTVTGVDRIYYQPSSAARFSDDVRSAVLAKALKVIQPTCLLIPATPLCRSLFPRVAILIGGGLTADCTELLAGQDNKLIGRKPSYGDRVLVDIETRPGFLPMFTLRPGIYSPCEKAGALPPVTELPAVGAGQSGVELMEVLPSSAGAASMLSASLILSAGKGGMEEESFAQVNALAEKLGGCVGGTRPLMDAGLLPFERQIGQTGYTVRPKVCLYLGVSGALQHTEGVKDCPVQIAVNTDPEAAVFSVADYGVVGDVKAMTAEMLRQLGK